MYSPQLHSWRKFSYPPSKTRRVFVFDFRSSLHLFFAYSSIFFEANVTSFQLIIFVIPKNRSLVSFGLNIKVVVGK